MRVERFEIQNFKGIRKAKLRLSNPNARIFTLVGLNESGKTTILETLNAFSPDIEGIHGIIQGIGASANPETFVPKSQEANFTDIVKISFFFSVEEDDLDAVERELGPHNVKLVRDSVPRTLQVDREYRFEASKYKSSRTIWFGDYRGFVGRKKTATRFTSKDEPWKQIVETLRRRMPRVVYFPNFLFDFPDKILVSRSLEEGTDQAKRINQYFVSLIEASLSSLDGNLNLQTHVVDRVLQAEPDTPFAAFISGWFGSTDARNVKATLARLSRELTQEIFGRWEKVLNRRLADTELEVESFLEPGPGGERDVWLEFTIRQGADRYRVAERSLGFRWFLCFLLFTRYATESSNSDGGIVFLFDEPASNLHSSAQARLLESFGPILDNKNIILYSTHSHHLINPSWLENSFVVQNGLDESKELEGSLGASREINISAVSYPEYVSSVEAKEYYYQPILDRIEYSPGSLSPFQGGIVVEGKSDYYILEYYRRLISPNGKYRFIPATGAGGLGAIVGLLISLGQRFQVLVDGDAAGTKALEGLARDLPIDPSRLSTYADFSDWKATNVKIEDFFSNDFRGALKKRLGTSRLTKKQILRAFATELAKDTAELPTDETTKERFAELFSSLDSSWSDVK